MKSILEGRDDSEVTAAPHSAQRSGSVDSRVPVSFRVDVGGGKIVARGPNRPRNRPSPRRVRPRRRRQGYIQHRRQTWGLSPRSTLNDAALDACRAASGVNHDRFHLRHVDDDP
jgi:hypothetical protein